MFDDVWEMFLEQLVVAPKHDVSPMKPKNLLGSVARHKEKFDVAAQKYLDGYNPDPDLDSW